jgi:hypothetical protein
VLRAIRLFSFMLAIRLGNDVPLSACTRKIAFLENVVGTQPYITAR